MVYSVAMRKLSLGLGLLGAVFAASASAECTCRANGADFQEGQVACIRLPSGSFLARCGKALNNTSWIRISDGCPQASASDAEAAGAVARHASSAAAIGFQSNSARMTP